ncbi:hypothetical protein RM533_07465 [Croceicoccus sp. F390]|uniref:SMODS and SLOG-associating 2TM effector domain-containing protein n=1 Tax=Croceicoccus esteveae TaxID=3075597 RepID=A0ABU2ZHE2_9SPHN|nr:hypothetical protein [Croceicoccus sp. F390]MDT0576023.1 hypothetical protein [Croceicoccus sp. F390]
MARPFAMDSLNRIFQPQPVEQWELPDEQNEHRAERKRLSENHYIRAQAMAAWLLATLVAINGGALATNLVSVSDATPFVSGIILAVLSGFASWQEAQDRSGLHYLESLPAGRTTAFGLKLKRKWQWRGPASGVAAKLLNWLSSGAFVIGCMMLSR